METLLKPTPQRDLLKNVFCGNQCSQLICPACGKVRSRLELFTNLSVQVKGFSDIHASLRSMLEGEILEDFRCENCQKKVNIRKRYLLADMPNTLIVHLNRIMYSYDTGENDKINSHFSFPQLLDLKDYSYKTLIQEEGEGAGVEYPELLNIDDDDYVYRLVGMNIHTGTADAGHYYSLIDIKRGQAEVNPYEDAGVEPKIGDQTKFQEWQQVA